ncbi:hypothetical protein [Virgibacillus sp. Bac332]|uniref:hypothetical protein n=1 Tax=Virgibacillus sp. Bac332 TaxID=2419842 RepID=UPI000EF43F51|nr:hypothetical protein [Virgibacillus sp. Bac332]
MIPKYFDFLTQKMHGEERYFAMQCDEGFAVYDKRRGKFRGFYTDVEVSEKLGTGDWLMIQKLNSSQKTFESRGKQIGKLVDEKNKQYGDAFSKSGDFLKILYPDGIKPEQYKDVLVLVRIFDKQMRIANGNQGEENAYQDIAGYGILSSGGNENE